MSDPTHLSDPAHLLHLELERLDRAYRNDPETHVYCDNCGLEGIDVDMYQLWDVQKNDEGEWKLVKVYACEAGECAWNFNDLEDAMEMLERMRGYSEGDE